MIDISRKTHQNDESQLRIDPSEVEHHDEEASLTHHTFGEDETSPHFLAPPRRTVVQDVKLDFSLSHSPPDLLRISGNDEMVDRMTIHAFSRLRRNHVDEQEKRQQDDDNPEPLARIEFRDDARSHTEAN